MSEQMTFADLPHRGRFSDLDPAIVEKFIAFDKANPRVYELFKRFAWELKSAGRNRFGAKAIVERIRWHYAVETIADDFTINNNFTSCYARLLILDEPAFRDFFETRRTPGTIGVAA